MLGTGNPTARMWFFKIDLCRLTRVFYVIISTEVRLLVIGGEPFPETCQGFQLQVLRRP